MTDSDEKEEKPIGLECLSCGCRHFNTDSTRPRRGGIVRYKSCRNCGRRARTTETIDGKK